MYLLDRLQYRKQSGNWGAFQRNTPGAEFEVTGGRVDQGACGWKRVSIEETLALICGSRIAIRV